MKGVVDIKVKFPPLILPVREYVDYNPETNMTTVHVCLDDLVVTYQMIWVGDVDKSLFPDMWNTVETFKPRPITWSTLNFI